MVVESVSYYYPPVYTIHRDTAPTEPAVAAVSFVIQARALGNAPNHSTEVTKTPPCSNVNGRTIVRRICTRRGKRERERERKKKRKRERASGGGRERERESGDKKKEREKYIYIYIERERERECVCVCI